MAFSEGPRKNRRRVSGSTSPARRAPRAGRNTLGYLIVAMQPFDAGEIVAKHSDAFREWIAEPAAREAWDDLDLRHELKLSFGEGWMRATWQPNGFFIFPGRFEPERWRSVLRSMHTIVISLERRVRSRRRHECSELT